MGFGWGPGPTLPTCQVTVMGHPGAALSRDRMSGGWCHLSRIMAHVSASHSNGKGRLHLSSQGVKGKLAGGGNVRTSIAATQKSWKMACYGPRPWEPLVCAEIIARRCGQVRRWELLCRHVWGSLLNGRDREPQWPG